MAAASPDVGTLKAMFEHWDEATLAERRERFSPPPPRYTQGVLAKYARTVSSASKGATTSVFEEA